VAEEAAGVAAGDEKKSRKMLRLNTPRRVCRAKWLLKNRFKGEKERERVKNRF